MRYEAQSHGYDGNEVHGHMSLAGQPTTTSQIGAVRQPQTHPTCQRTLTYPPGRQGALTRREKRGPKALIPEYRLPKSWHTSIETPNFIKNKMCITGRKATPRCIPSI